MAVITIRRLSGVRTAAVPYVLAMDALPYKNDIRWTRIVARCLETKLSRIELFLMHGSTEYLIHSQGMLDKDNSLDAVINILAPGSFRVCARFKTPDADAECELYAFGSVVEDTPLP